MVAYPARRGVFDFGWLDRMIDLLHAVGIAVDRATATASPPPCMHEMYPQILPVTQGGKTLGLDYATGASAGRQVLEPDAQLTLRLEG